MRTAKLFRNGQSQAVRLPKEFRLPGTEVRIKKVGDAVLLLPIRSGWENLKEAVSQFTSDFMEEREQPIAQQRRKRLFR